MDMNHNSDEFESSDRTIEAGKPASVKEGANIPVGMPADTGNLLSKEFLASLALVKLAMSTSR